MYYTRHKRFFPEDVVVYIEEYDRQNGTVLFDFVDSNEYNQFNGYLNQSSNLELPSMVRLLNYTGKHIQENTLYAINKDVIQQWVEHLPTNAQNNDSYLIGYTIDLKSFPSEIFGPAITLNEFYDGWLNFIAYGQTDFSKVKLVHKGKIAVNARNVGQGNWNEVLFDDNIKISFDCGAPLHASKSEVRTILGNRLTIYPGTKPLLILSHWDKDHYHCLVGMTDEELKNSFSAVICLDRIPNLTSRILFGRLQQTLGYANTYTLSAYPREDGDRQCNIFPITPIDSQVVIYNAQHHKNRNLSGLSLVIRTASGSCILPGDLHYQQVSRGLLPHLNYVHTHHLIVPHHGGKAGSYCYNLPKKMRVGHAIISVGTNSYGHPYGRYLQALRNDGFYVQQTNATGQDILVSL